MKLKKQLIVARYRQSPIMDRLAPQRAQTWVKILDRFPRDNPKVVNLERFSLLDDPEQTLRSLKDIVECERTEISAHLNFNDDYCHDAAAYLVLAEIWPHMSPIFVGGRMLPAVQKVLSAIGVGEHLGMRLMAVKDYRDVWAFPLRRRRPAKSSLSQARHLAPQTREDVSDEFCDAVNEWLDHPEIDQELTKEGKGWLGGIVGELLCNAERHSQHDSNDGDWSITAYMVRRSVNGVKHLQCYMAFLSVGQSVSESLEQANDEIKRHLDSYVHRHRNCGLSRETLRTVVALQDTITCDPNARENETGGTGLQDVLDFVDDLGGTTLEGQEPRVTIISGSSCIRLRRPYIKGVRKVDARSPRLLWCNEANSSEFPPDPNVALDLTEHFAGTVVSVAFTLDPVYLNQNLESADEHDG